MLIVEFVLYNIYMMRALLMISYYMFLFYCMR